MAVYPIRVFGDPVLRITATAIEEIDGSIRRLAADMIETMHEAPGVGLAAPQIGVSKRVIVFDVQDEEGPKVVINPVLEETSGEFTFEEGCLSVPERYWEITRPAFAVISGLNLDGEPVEYSGDEVIGRVLQHEVDHLEGILLIERLEPRVRKVALKELRDAALGLPS